MKPRFAQANLVHDTISKRQLGQRLSSPKGSRLRVPLGITLQAV
jgi:hypothetical protein